MRALLHVQSLEEEPPGNLAGRVWLSAFACVNILLVEAMLSSYPEVREALLVPYVALLFLILVLLAAQVLPRLVAQSFHALLRLRHSEFSFDDELLLCAGLIIVLLRAAYALIAALFSGGDLGIAEEAPWIFLMLGLLEWVGYRADALLVEGASSSLAELVPHARRIDAEGQSTVSSSTLVRGDRIALAAGDMVPADGVIESGLADVLESRHSFARRRIFKRVNDELYAASQLVHGEVVLRVLEAPLHADINASFEQVQAACAREQASVQRGAVLQCVLKVLVAAATVGAALYAAGAGMPLQALASLAASGLFLALLAQRVRDPQLLMRAVYLRMVRCGVFAAAPTDVFRRAASIRTLVLWASSRDGVRPHLEPDIQLLDPRVSEAGIREVLASLYAASDDPAEQAAGAALAIENPSCVLKGVSDFRRLEGGGIEGRIENARFLAGPQELLVQQRVQFDAADAGGYYLALETVPLARYVLGNSFVGEARAAAKELGALGINLRLISPDDAASVDALGKATGLELSSIDGGVNEEMLAERLVALHTVALASRYPVAPHVARSADMTLSCFDERRFDFTMTDCVLFDEGLRKVPLVFHAARAWRVGTLMLAGLAGIVAVVGLAAAFAGALSPVGALASVLAVAGLRVLLLNRLLRLA